MDRSSFLLLFIFFGAITRAQSPGADSAAYQQAKTNAIEEYHRVVGLNAPIYQGIKHIGYLPSIAGFAYYPAKDWQQGTILFDDVLYKDVMLKYDLVTDEVILQHPGGFAIKLFSPRVKYFTFLDGYTFIYLVQGVDKNPLRTGFYEQLRTGRITLLAKRNKVINENVTATGIERQFIETTNYYLIKNGVYHPISNQRSMLAGLEDRKKDIQQYLRKNHIKFRKNREYALLKIADFYNQ